MSYISKIDLSTAPQEVRAAVDNHLAQGYQLTNEKLTLLHNVTAFHTLEESSYELDRELQRLIGKRAADFYEYAISLQNDCLVCSTYFRKPMIKAISINPNTADGIARRAKHSGRNRNSVKTTPVRTAVARFSRQRKRHISSK